MKRPTEAWKNGSAALALGILVSAGSGCRGGGASSADGTPSPESATTATADAVAIETTKSSGEPAPPSGTASEATARENAGEPTATPVRESLKLLAERGASEVASIRQERKAIYRLFGTFTPEQQKDVSSAVALAQQIRWDDRPEELQKAPAQLHAAVKALLPVSAKYMDLGTEKLRKYSEMQKEVEGGKKHSEKVMDKLQSEGSGEMKVGRNLAFLVRSLFDEARVYSTYGSIAMRAELKEAFGAMKGQAMPVEQADLGLQKLLFELKVSGVEAPTLD